MEFEIVLKKAEEGGFLVSCPAISGCMSEGETKEEAIENIKEAIEGCIEALQDEQPTISRESEMIKVSI